MFNIFPKFGSPGDCASVDDLTGKQATNWFYTSTPTFTINGKTYKADELSQYIGELLTENQGLKNELEAIEEDGTVEHNEAIKLRQENAHLKVEIERLQGFEKWHQPELCAETINELTKEVNGLRHLKEENVRLMERVNEIDSDQNEEYRAEIFTLKNDIAVWREKYTKLLEKYNGTVTMGGLKYMEAKLQITQNRYKKCAEERDEFKHQLNAANKEIDQLKRWKKEQLTVQSWWDKVDSYVRDHDDAPLGGFVANTCLNFLKERDELKKRIDGLSLTIDRKNFEIDDLKTEIKKLKEDIVDYVIEKDDELKKAQDWIKLNEKFYECNCCGFKVNHIANLQGSCSCCEGGTIIERVNEQKHPMYPFHWSGYDGAASTYPKQYSDWLKEQKDKAESEKWLCPCNMCKSRREQEAKM